VNSTTNTFSDTTVSPSTTYQYTVIAHDGATNTSAPSAPAGVTTPAQPTVTTPPPTTVTTTPPTTTSTTPLIVPPPPPQPSGWFSPNLFEPTATSDQSAFSPDVPTAPEPVAAVGDS